MGAHAPRGCALRCALHLFAILYARGARAAVRRTAPRFPCGVADVLTRLTPPPSRFPTLADDALRRRVLQRLRVHYAGVAARRCVGELVHAAQRLL